MAHALEKEYGAVIEKSTMSTGIGDGPEERKRDEPSRHCHVNIADKSDSSSDYDEAEVGDDKLWITFDNVPKHSSELMMPEKQIAGSRSKNNAANLTAESESDDDYYDLESASDIDNTIFSDATGNEMENSHLSVSVSFVHSIEYQFTKYERVSLSFLFFDDVEKCLKYCSKSLKIRHYHGLEKYCLRNPYESWCMKLLECLYLLKNYVLLRKCGLEKYVAARVFRASSKIMPQRHLLYTVCENLSQKETVELMNSIPNVPNEQYLEIFFLKLTEPVQWSNVIGYLKRCNNQRIASLVDQFDSLLPAEKQAEIAPSKPILQSSDPPENSSKTFMTNNNIYPIHDPANVGFCLIINQIEFMQHTRRLGSEKDCQALEEIMKEFNFSVLTVNNWPQEYFGRRLAFLIEEHFKKEHSVFFFVILSHGGRGVIFSSDSLPVSIEQDLFPVLRSVKKLKGIPKVLVIQACQGNLFLKSEKMTSDGVKIGDVSTDLYPLTPEINRQIGEYISDACIVMSTVQGFKSFRMVDLGTHFIRHLCHSLKKYPYDQLNDILIEVNRLVTNEVVETEIEGVSFTQQPEIKNYFKKKLYLRPKMN